MSKKWHSGPPPSVGWWPADVGPRPSKGYYRWWDGAHWSFHCFASESAEEAAFWAEVQSGLGDYILWQHRPKSWPARSHT